MADTKISALTDGGTLQVDDQIPVARGAANNKLTGDDFVCVLARQAPVTVANTTTETAIASGTVPANQLGTNRRVVWEIGGAYLNNNNVTVTLRIRIKFGGTTIYDDTVAVSALSASLRALFIRVMLTAAGATNAQDLSGFILLGTPGGATTGVGDVDVDEIESNTPLANDSVALDSTANQNFEITVQWSAAAATLSLTGFGGVLTRF